MFSEKKILYAIFIVFLSSLFISCTLKPKLVNGEFQIYKSDEGRMKMMELYREFLSKWPVPYRETDVDTSFGRTHIITVGSEENRKKIIMLFGAGANSSCNNASFISAFKDFCIYSIDIIDQPGKSRPTRLPKNNKDYADWLNEVFTAMHIDKASIIGTSFGGYIAQWFFYYHPGRVDKLILISTSYVKRIPFPIELIHHSIFDDTEKFLEWANGDQPVKDQEYKQLYIKLFKYINNYCISIFPYITVVPEDNVKKISKPVLIIMGEKDKFIWDAKAAHKFITKVNNPYIRFELIPGEGHFFLNNISTLTKLSNEFLKQ